MRPRKLTDAAGAVLWDRIATPFGEEHTVTGTLTQKLEFPGQIEDSETAFFQNWHREYDPELGRYVQSDPIGLLGGINTYGYVGGNPVMYVDPMGLDYKAPGTIGHGGIKGNVDNNVIWVADIPREDAKNGKTIICGCGKPPENSDVDFVFLPGLDWIKIVNGYIRLDTGGYGGRSAYTPTGGAVYFGARSYGYAGGNAGLPVLTLQEGAGVSSTYGYLLGQNPPHKFLDDLANGRIEQQDKSCEELLPSILN